MKYKQFNMFSQSYPKFKMLKLEGRITTFIDGILTVAAAENHYVCFAIVCSKFHIVLLYSNYQAKIISITLLFSKFLCVGFKKRQICLPHDWIYLHLYLHFTIFKRVTTYSSMMCKLREYKLVKNSKINFCGRLRFLAVTAITTPFLYHIRNICHAKSQLQHITLFLG